MIHPGHSRPRCRPQHKREQPEQFPELVPDQQTTQGGSHSRHGKPGVTQTRLFTAPRRGWFEQGHQTTRLRPQRLNQYDRPGDPTLINQITTYNGGTNTASAIWDAYQQLQILNQPGAVNVIVVFTDGLANNTTASFISLVSPSAGCSSLTNPLTGVIGSDTGETVVFGLFDPTAQSLNDPTELRPAPQSGGCANISNNGGLNTNIGAYLTGLPSMDVNGNSTNGTGSIGAYKPVNLSLINPVSVTNAGLNAFDDAANRIRSDTTLRPQIYAIGLGNNPGLPPDQVLLARVANDPGSAYFNSAQPAGLFVFSPTIAQLHSAFLRVASQVLRLSR